MKIISLKVYEGNNIKRKRRIIKVDIENSSDLEVNKYLKTYFRVSFLLGYREKLVDIEKQAELFRLWVTYTEEEVSKYLLNNIPYNIDNTESLVGKADNLVKNGFLYDVIRKCREKEIPVIEVTEDLFQLGYGKNSIDIGRNYQSYENMLKVEISRNRKTLWQCLRYAHIPKVDGKVLYSIEEIKEVSEFKYPINLRSIDKTSDVKITISDEKELNIVLDNMMKMYTRAFVYSGNVKYRIICYKGEVGVVLKKENNYKIIEIDDKSLEVLEIIQVLERLKEFCMKVYSSIPIKFMYIDLQEDEGFKVVDLGCVFDVGEELREVKDKVIEYFIKSIRTEKIGLIPIFSITGTNGKTTTSRLINYILNNLGFKSALTSTGGIFVVDKKIKVGDTTGFLSAREVLTNKEVEAAVVETARGGIYRNGLGYERAKAAIITSISEDHIGMDEINNIDDLVYIKTVIIDELDTGGKIIARPQKELAEYLKGRSNVCLYDTEKNKLMESHLNNGGEALYLEDGNVIWSKNRETVKLFNVKEIPFTHDGNSKGNILNVMAAISAVSTIYGDTQRIISAIKELKCDLYFNPGRQNILDFGKFKVILDYGHNAAAFNEVLSIAKSFNPSRLTGIITTAGDRLDRYIKELGNIASNYCDYIIIREQDDLRGRKQGAVAKLIEEGVLEEGSFNENNLSIIYKEEDAIVYAMEKAVEGEVIVLFTQCLNIIIPAINGFLKDHGEHPIGEGLDLTH